MLLLETLENMWLHVIDLQATDSLVTDLLWSSANLNAFYLTPEKHLLVFLAIKRLATPIVGLALSSETGGGICLIKL